jgi:hypothetical protein
LGQRRRGEGKKCQILWLLQFPKPTERLTSKSFRFLIGRDGEVIAVVSAIEAALTAVCDLRGIDRAGGVTLRWLGVQ